MQLKKRINIEIKIYGRLIKLKERMTIIFTRSLILFFGRFFGRCSNPKRDKRGFNESVKVV